MYHLNRIKSNCAAARMMGAPDRLADVACSYPFSWVRRLDREEAIWMVNEMGWTPEIFPNSGHTAMMRCQFREAIAAFNLQGAVREAAARRNAETAPQTGVNPRADAVSEVPAVVGVDPGADPAVAGGVPPRWYLRKQRMRTW